MRFAGSPDPTKLKAYSEALVKNYAGVTSVRALAAAERKKRALGQLQLLNSHGVSHDYGNVQCLNCHDKNRDHPFDGSTGKGNADMGTKCLQCHTADQSPDWYQDGQPNKAVLAQRIKSVACPSGK